MDADTLARLRPAGRSVADLQGALDALAQERVACERRSVAARADRTTALIAGAAWHVAEAGRIMKAAADDVEMLDALAPALRERLALAEMVEARAIAELTEANELAETAATAFAAALPRYAKHAEAISEIARLGQAADQARHHAATLAAKQGLPAAHLVLPAGTFTASPAGSLSMASLIRLPAPDGTGLLVGSWGQEHQPVPAFRYAS
jgi:hypothetical protein